MPTLPLPWWHGLKRARDTAMVDLQGDRFSRTGILTILVLIYSLWVQYPGACSGLV